MSTPTHILLDSLEAAERQIRNKVRMVLANEQHFATLSTGERIAVAFVLNRPKLLDQCWGTMLEGADRLGPEWLKAALRVQRSGY